MKVKELIAKLKDFDPEENIKITSPSWNFDLPITNPKALQGFNMSDIAVIVVSNHANTPNDKEIYLMDEISYGWLSNLEEGKK